MKILIVTLLMLLSIPAHADDSQTEPHVEALSCFDTRAVCCPAACAVRGTSDKGNRVLRACMLAIGCTKSAIDAST